MLTDEQIALLRNLKVDLSIGGRADESEAVRQALEEVDEARASLLELKRETGTATTYWVSFNHEHGSGACAVTMALPVRTGADVGIMGDFVKSSHGLRQVAIVNFIPLEGM
ncbi:MAG TPA: hypothetical protein VM783_00880 [Candidatus Acidoferrum sp.]|nr:hypothetical protein [Candidatus Acidoferrum sp.]